LVGIDTLAKPFPEF